MLRRLILARIASAEKDWGVSLEYCRFILRVSLRAFFKFPKFLAVDEYRRVPVTLPESSLPDTRIAEPAFRLQ